MTAAAGKRAPRKEGSNFIRPETTHLDVISATKTVTPAWVSSAQSDAATDQQEINKKIKKPLGCIVQCPWSFLTDGVIIDTVPDAFLLGDLTVAALHVSQVILSLITEPEPNMVDHIEKYIYWITDAKSSLAPI